MGLKLNRINDEVVIENLKFVRRLLDDMLVSPPGPTAQAGTREHFSRIAAVHSLTIGSSLYQQQQSPREVRKVLLMAANYYLSMYEARHDLAEDRSWDDWEFFEVINVVTAFGSVEARLQLLTISQWLFAQPLESTDLSTLREYLRAFAGYLRGERNLLATLPSIPCSTNDCENWVRPSANALRAIIDRSSPALEIALHQLIASQKYEALSGEYRNRPQGLLCLPALALMKLAKEVGIRFHLESDYAPMTLLEV